MLIEIPDEAIAKVALGVNGSRYQFFFEQPDRSGPPLIVDVSKATNGLRFRAHQASSEKGDITLSFDEIFNNVPRVSRLLKELESGVPS
jgi:hypothetical protein